MLTDSDIGGCCGVGLASLSELSIFSSRILGEAPLRSDNNSLSSTDMEGNRWRLLLSECTSMSRSTGMRGESKM